MDNMKPGRINVDDISVLMSGLAQMLGSIMVHADDKTVDMTLDYIREARRTGRIVKNAQQ